MKSSSRFLVALFFVSMGVMLLGLVHSIASIHRGENLQNPSAIGFMGSGIIGLLTWATIASTAASLHKRVTEIENKCARTEPEDTHG